MLKRIGLLSCVVILGSAATLRAQSSCDAVLIPSNFTDYNNTKLQVQLLKLIDKENYSTVSQKIGGSVTVPIYDVPVSFGGNYDTFRQQRDQVFQKETLDVKDEQVRSIASTFLPPEIANAWSECMKNKHSGLVLEPRYSSETKLLVHGTWNPDAGVGDVKTTNIIINGGEQSGIPGTWIVNGAFDFVVNRSPGDELVLVVQVERGYSAAIALPPYSKTTMTKQVVSASINCGKVSPRLYVLATNHNNGHRDDYFETSGIDLPPDVSVDRSKSDSYGGGEGGASASLSSTCSQIVKGDPKRALTVVRLKGNVHAETGNGFAGTGFHPGGGAGVYPFWTAKMSLPGSVGQSWDLNLTVGNHLIEKAGANAACTATIDGPSLKTLAAKVGEDKQTTFQSLEPGDYNIRVDCNQPPKDYPFPAAQVLALWSGTASQDTEPVEVSVRVDAKLH